MAEAAGIFVSHAHEDNAWCRTFLELLRQAGVDVRYDEHDVGGWHGGRRYGRLAGYQTVVISSTLVAE
jgi:hypothetical protein